MKKPGRPKKKLPMRWRNRTCGKCGVRKPEAAFLKRGRKRSPESPLYAWCDGCRAEHL